MSRDEAYYHRLHEKFHTAYHSLTELAHEALKTDHEIENAMKYAQAMSKLHKDSDQLRNAIGLLKREIRRIHMTPVNSSEDRANKSKALSEGEGQLKQAHTKLKEVKRQLRSIKRVTRRDVLRQLRNFRTKRRKSDSALKA